MKGNSSKSRQRHTRLDESGQTMVFVVLALGLFLLGAVGFAVDITNLWFHRQTAQNAADAACTAGAMDLYVKSQGTALPSMGFTPGTPFNCSGSSSAAPCKYAALNGYNGTGLVSGAASNDVSVSFPSTALGILTPPASLAPTPFIRVDVVDRARVFLMSLLSGTRTQDVRAFAVCGLEMEPSPIPIMVLAPTGSPLSLGGASGISIYGGGSRSVQINSSASNAGNGANGIDLHQGGPNLTGSDIGVVGGPVANPGANLGTTGKWAPYGSPIGDPFACIPAPGQASGCAGVAAGPPIPGPPAVPADLAANVTCNTSAKIQAGNCHVPSGYHACPDSGGCTLYTAGRYTNGLPFNGVTLFDPGLYYITGGDMGGNHGTARPGNGGGTTFDGSTFYFADSSSVNFHANTGGPTSVPFTSSNTLCPGASGLPANLPATLNGSLLLGPCTGTYGDPLGASDPAGMQRGILYFQNRSVAAQPALGGGGDTAFVGAWYFHQCHTGGADTGTNCSASAYNTTLGMGGNSCSSAYSLGTMVVDQIGLHGTPCIKMDLNPAASFSSLKVGLFR